MNVQIFRRCVGARTGLFHCPHQGDGAADVVAEVVQGLFAAFVHGLERGEMDNSVYLVFERRGQVLGVADVAFHKNAASGR